MKTALLVLTFLIPLCAHGQIALITTENGETVQFEVSEQATLEEIASHLNAYNPQHLVINLNKNAKSIDIADYEMKKHGGPLGRPRNFYNELTHIEKKDIRYIITSLANDSLISIAIHRTNLENAGDRIDHIHPLRFLLTVFMNEELKVGVRNIRGRGWIWGDFCSGLKESLRTEHSIGNLKKEHIQELASKLELDPNLLMSSLDKQNWDEFIEMLITKVQRKGESSRYDS